MGWPSSSITYCVMSTTGLMGRKPARRSRSRSHSGEAILLLMPRTTRQVNFGQPSGRRELHREGVFEGSRPRLAAGIRTAAARQGGDFARDAQHRHGIAAIRRDIELEQFVIELHVGAQVLAHRRIGRQFHDAFGGFGQPQLLRGAQHAEGIDTAQFRGRDGVSTGKLRAHGGQRSLRARRAHWRRRRRSAAAHYRPRAPCTPAACRPADGARLR